MEKVQIVPDENGNTIRTSSDKSEYAYVRLMQTKEVISSSGWLNVKDVTALLHGKKEDFKKVKMKDRKELSGRIVIQESTTPFNEKDPDRDLKYAGDTGIICCSYGEPIYRRTVYDATASLNDEYVAHTNGDDIRKKNAESNNSVKSGFDNLTKLATDDNQVDLDDAIKEVEDAIEEPIDELVEESAEEIVEESAEELEEVKDESFEL